MVNDNVNPNHYPNQGNDKDWIAFCLNNDVGAIESNVGKYVIRWKHKNGLEDLYKARVYLDRLIDYEELKILKKL